MLLFIIRTGTQFNGATSDPTVDNPVSCYVNSMLLEWVRWRRILSSCTPHLQDTRDVVFDKNRIEFYNMEHMHISGIEPSSMILAKHSKVNSWQFGAKGNGIINPQNDNFNWKKKPLHKQKCQKAKWQHKQRHKKVRLHSGCGPT